MPLGPDGCSRLQERLWLGVRHAQLVLPVLWIAQHLRVDAERDAGARGIGRLEQHRRRNGEPYYVHP